MLPRSPKARDRGHPSFVMDVGLVEARGLSAASPRSLFFKFGGWVDALDCVCDAGMG